MSDQEPRGERNGGGRDPAAVAAPSGLAGGPEFDLIRRFLRGREGVPRADVRVGPGDDCAVVVGDGIVLTIDLSIEDVHFRRAWMTGYEIGCRAAVASLSDLAAMAARPIGILVSLGVPASDREEFAVEVMRGATDAAEAVDGVVLGGDVTGSRGPLVVDVAAVGEARHPLLRSGAREGDEVWVTGLLGGAAAAVAALERGEGPEARAREALVAPRARVREARWLADRGLPTAMIDLSDGLGGDAAHIAAASGVSISLEAAAVPVHPAAAAADAGGGLALALSGGEDYEICFTARPGAVGAVREEFERAFGVALTRVGVVGGGAGVYLVHPDGSRSALSSGGFQHFRQS